MKRIWFIGFVMVWGLVIPLHGQSLPCLEEVEKLSDLSMQDVKKGLTECRIYYQANPQLPDQCLAYLEYLLGFLELQQTRIDSADVYMKQFLHHSLRVPSDSVVMEGYLWYASYLRITDRYPQTRQWLDSAAVYMKKRRIQDKYLQSRFYSVSGDYFSMGTHNLAKAEENYLRALELFSEYNQCQDCAVVFNNMGYMFMNEGYLEKAAHYFYQALLLRERTATNASQKEMLQHNTFINLSFCYRLLHQLPQAEHYGKKALAIATRLNSNEFRLLSYRTLAAAQMEAGHVTEAQQLLREAEKLCLRTKQKEEMSYTYRYIGELYALYLNNPAEGKWYLDKGKTLAEERQLSLVYHLHNYSLGRYYLHQKEYEKALQALVLSLKQGRQVRDRVYEPILLELLYKIYQQQGNAAQALNYYTQYIGLRDSILTDAAQLKFKELEGKYNEQSNHLVIDRLQTANALQKAEIKQNWQLIGILAGGSLLASGLLFLLYQAQKNKKKIAQQKQQLYGQQLKELEQQRQLEVFAAIVEGQETERARLARDLHDGLGGMLAGTKMYLSQINQTGINGQAVYLQTAVNQIDYSMQELRRIARNMMPETLRKFGLPTALKDLCQSLTQCNLRIQFQAIGLSSDLPQAAQLTIYRIVQELIANAIKHAEATEILVQCLQNTQTLHITVEDNGKGFDPARSLSQGMGLSNVRNRVEYLNGRLDIQSEPHVGTTLTIEIPV